MGYFSLAPVCSFSLTTIYRFDFAKRLSRATLQLSGGTAWSSLCAARAQVCSQVVVAALNMAALLRAHILIYIYIYTCPRRFPLCALALHCNRRAQVASQARAPVRRKWQNAESHAQNSKRIQKRLATGFAAIGEFPKKGIILQFSLYFGRTKNCTKILQSLISRS